MSLFRRRLALIPRISRCLSSPAAPQGNHQGSPSPFLGNLRIFMAGAATGCAIGVSYLALRANQLPSHFESKDGKDPGPPLKPVAFTKWKFKEAQAERGGSGAVATEVQAAGSGNGSGHRPAFEEAIADAAEVAMRSVVNIRVEEEHSGFFRDRLFVSLGSGIVIGEEGTILTNAHVVSGFFESKAMLTVTLSDGREYNGIVYSADPITDLAVVKLTDLTENLPAAKLGSSKKMRAGDWVLALGCPFGFRNSVSAGIISAISRFSDEVGQMKNQLEFYQTDLNFHEGNSGGPLVNLRGEVIGINTVRADADRLSFSMRIDSAMEIISQLCNEGRVVRPFLGLKFVTLTPALLSTLDPNDRSKVSGQTGVLVIKVLDGSPAALGGLQTGDVIQKINNTPVTSSAEVLRVFGNRVGEEFRIELKRKEANGAEVDRVHLVTPTELNIYVNQKETQFVYQQ